MYCKWCKLHIKAWHELKMRYATLHPPLPLSLLTHFYRLYNRPRVKEIWNVIRIVVYIQCTGNKNHPGYNRYNIRITQHAYVMNDFFISQSFCLQNIIEKWRFIEYKLFFKNSLCLEQLTNLDAKYTKRRVRGLHTSIRVYLKIICCT